MRAHFVFELNGSIFEKSLELPFTPAKGMNMVVCDHPFCIGYAGYELDNELWYIRLVSRRANSVLDLREDFLQNGWINYSE